MKFVNKNNQLFETALIGKCDNSKVEVCTDHTPIHIHWKGCKIDVSDENDIKTIEGNLSKRELNTLNDWLSENCTIKNMNKLTNIEAINAIWDSLNPEDD